MSHTPTPWKRDSFEHFRKGQKLGNVVFYHSIYMVLDADYERAMECVNACEGLRLEDVKLSEKHRKACLLWELTMMELLGEDGPGSVREAINKLKAERDELQKSNNILTKERDELRQGFSDVADQLMRVRTFLSEDGGVDNARMCREITEVLNKYIS